MKRPTEVELFEQNVIDNADHYTVFVRVDVFDRRKATIKDRAKAIEVAQAWGAETGRAILVYAISPEGRHALLTTIPRENQR